MRRTCQYLEARPVLDRRGAAREDPMWWRLRRSTCRRQSVVRWSSSPRGGEAMPDGRRRRASSAWLVRVAILDRRIQTLLPDLQRGAQIDVAALESAAALAGSRRRWPPSRPLSARSLYRHDGARGRALVEESQQPTRWRRSRSVPSGSGRGAGVDQKADDSTCGQGFGARTCSDRSVMRRICAATSQLRCRVQLVR